jgi:hypothetical protein
LDDNTVTALNGSEIAWGIVVYPFQSLDANGLLTAVANVYSVATGTVNGAYLGTLGNTALQVTGPYANCGLPDGWFAQYFGMAPNPRAAPTADPTGCGQNNQFKYLAGLDPTNAASLFKLRIAAVAGQPGQKKLIFSPRWNDRTYTPVFRTNLLTGDAWVALTNTNVTDSGAQRTVIDLNATAAQKFYRISISDP